MLDIHKTIEISKIEILTGQNLGFQRFLTLNKNHLLLLEVKDKELASSIQDYQLEFFLNLFLFHRTLTIFLSEEILYHLDGEWAKRGYS